MDGPYDFLRRPRIGMLPLGLGGPGIATALADALYPFGRHDTFGADEQSAPLPTPPRGAAADARRKSWWNHGTSPSPRKQVTWASNGTLQHWFPLSR